MLGCSWGFIRSVQFSVSRADLDLSDGGGRVCRHELPTDNEKQQEGAGRSTEAREADIADLHDSMFG